MPTGCSTTMVEPHPSSRDCSTTRVLGSTAPVRAGSSSSQASQTLVSVHKSAGRRASQASPWSS